MKGSDRLSELDGNASWRFIGWEIIAHVQFGVFFSSLQSQFSREAICIPVKTGRFRKQKTPDFANQLHALSISTFFCCQFLPCRWKALVATTQFAVTAVLKRLDHCRQRTNF